RVQAAGGVVHARGRVDAPLVVGLAEAPGVALYLDAGGAGYFDDLQVAGLVRVRGEQPAQHPAFKVRAAVGVGAHAAGVAPDRVRHDVGQQGRAGGGLVAVHGQFRVRQHAGHRQPHARLGRVRLDQVAHAHRGAEAGAGVLEHRVVVQLAVVNFRPGARGHWLHGRGFKVHHHDVQVAVDGRVDRPRGVHHVDGVRAVVVNLTHVQAAQGAQLLADQGVGREVVVIQADAGVAGAGGVGRDALDFAGAAVEQDRPVDGCAEVEVKVLVRAEAVLVGDADQAARLVFVAVAVDGGAAVVGQFLHDG